MNAIGYYTFHYCFQLHDNYRSYYQASDEPTSATHNHVHISIILPLLRIITKLLDIYRYFRV